MKNLKFAASLTFMFGFRLLLPAPSFAYIMQDVQNYLISHPAPSGCSNRTEEYAANGQQGVKVLQRCGASTTIKQISKDYIYGQAVAVSKFPHGVARDVYFCEDYKNYDYNIGLSLHSVTSGTVYINHYIPDRVTYCDGRVEQRDVLNRYPNHEYLDVPDCLDVFPYVVNDCTQLDTLLADFFPITNCIDGDYDGFYKYDAVWCPQGNDCDDGNLKINPDTIWHRDIDNDRYPDLSYQSVGPQCQRPSGYKYYNELKKYEHDCDDTKSDLNPQHPCDKKKLAPVSGNGQEGDILTSLENPFIVKVVDEHDNPTTGNVTWQVTSAPQDAQGQGLSEQSGLSTTLTLGDALGNYTVTATCTDCTEDKTATFTAKASGPKLTLKVEPEEVWPSKTGGNSVADVMCEVISYNGRPLNGYGVEFKAEPDETSGGHDSGHNEGRPKGTFSDNSICYTDNGQCAIKYTASEFGGKEKITAKLQSLRLDQIPSQKKDLTVRVPDLFPLSTGTIFRLTGQTTEHKSNHYGSLTTIVNTHGIANDFYAQFDATLGINDMTLANGGGFDIFGNWLDDVTPPQCVQAGHGHCSHRKGTSVDIDRCAPSTTPNNPNPQGDCSRRGSGWIEVDRTSISNICKNHSGRLVEEATIHCELPQ